MESLAYIHLALNYEAELEGSAPVVRKFKLFAGLNWRNLPGKACICLLSLAVALGISSIATSAMATIQMGSQGSEVTALQQHLRQLGYFKERVTGNFDASTTEAVIRFQKDRGLAPDGIVGTKTAAALDEQLSQNSESSVTSSVAANPTSDNASTILELGSIGPEVRNIQQSLKQAGLYNGPLDGVFNAATEVAVRQFQQAKKLTVDGIVGPRTLALLPGVTQQSASLPLRRVENSRLFAKTPRDPQVEALQRRLQQLGYYHGGISGYLNAETKQAVSQFQRAQSLERNGILGSNTLTALATADSRNSVQALQKRLQESGFYAGPIDGVLTSQTKAAIVAAQQAYRLP